MHGHSQTFTEFGYFTDRHSLHETCNTGRTGHVARSIKDQVYAVVFVEYTLFRIPKPHATSAVHNIMTWARLCTQVGVPFVIIGFFGTMRADPQLLELTDSRQLRFAYHHLCHLGLTVDPTLKHHQRR